MLHHPNRASARARLFAFALAAGASIVPASLVFAWPFGGGGDVTIENFTAHEQDGSALVIARADFVNANLSKDEIVKMLTPDTPEADERVLVQKFKADKISIPSIDIATKEGGKIHIHDVAANHIDAGKVGDLGFAAMEASGTDNGGAYSLKSGALRLEGLDLADALKAVGAPQEAAQKGRLGHLTWQSLDIVAPDAESGPGKTIHIALASAEVRSSYDGDILKHGDTKLTGLIVEPSPDSEFGKNLAELGYSKLEMALVIGADYQPAAKTFTLDELTIEGAQMGSIRLTANFGDIDPALFSPDNSARLAALLGCSISSLEIKVVNSGLFEKALAFTAKQQGASADALKQQWSAMTGQMAPMLLGGDPSALKVAAEAQKFIEAPKNLTISIKAKSGGLKAADFEAIDDPAAFVSKLDIAAAANQ
ncbi:MAG: hypothetical protein ABSC25_02165 [Roseiarcus sp.]|jgi:hypothetical protein